MLYNTQSVSIFFYFYLVFLSIVQKFRSYKTVENVYTNTELTEYSSNLMNKTIDERSHMTLCSLYTRPVTTKWPSHDYHMNITLKSRDFHLPSPSAELRKRATGERGSGGPHPASGWCAARPARARILPCVTSDPPVGAAGLRSAFPWSKSTREVHNLYW